MGGSFTVSNLGMFGLSHFSAIINPPQVGRVRRRAGPACAARAGTHPWHRVTSTGRGAQVTCLPCRVRLASRAREQQSLPPVCQGRVCKPTAGTGLPSSALYVSRAVLNIRSLSHASFLLHTAPALSPPPPPPNVSGSATLPLCGYPVRMYCRVVAGVVARALFAMLLEPKPDMSTTPPRPRSALQLHGFVFSQVNMYCRPQ